MFDQKVTPPKMQCNRYAISKILALYGMDADQQSLEEYRAEEETLKLRCRNKMKCRMSQNSASFNTNPSVPALTQEYMKREWWKKKKTWSKRGNENSNPSVILMVIELGHWVFYYAQRPQVNLYHDTTEKASIDGVVLYKADLETSLIVSSWAFNKLLFSNANPAELRFPP